MIGPLVALVLVAQTFAPVAAYTTSDPVDPERLGLATPWGRYAIVLGDGCEGMGPDLNVTLGPAGEQEPGVAWIDGCRIVLEALMSEVPCFTIADVCDVAAEVDE